MKPEEDEIEQAIKEEAAEQRIEKLVQAEPVQGSSESPVTPRETSVQRYLTVRDRITFELDSGFYTLPVISVTIVECGIMIMMPAGNNDTTFAPKPGASVGIRFGEKHFDCFSPGAVFTVPELEVMVIMLIRKDIKSDESDESDESNESNA